MAWQVDGSELVTAEAFARESRAEMAVFDSLPAARRRELDASGQSAIAFLEWEAAEGVFLDW